MIRVIRILLLAILLISLASGIALAYLYRAPVSVTENASTSYTMLPVIWSQNNDWLADNGFMKSTANDTRVQTLGGLNKPWMVADNKTLTAIPVPANSQTNLYFVTGESAASAMDIITGLGGYVTVLDDPLLKFGNKFQILLTDVYIDTTAGANKHIIYKNGAVVFDVSGSVTGNITFEIVGGSSVTALAIPSGLYSSLEVTANVTHLSLLLNSVVRDIQPFTNNVTDNANDWVLLSGNTTMYVGSFILNK